MQYFFQDTFISKVKKLLKKNAYKDCEKAIINDIFNLPIDDVMTNCAARRLNVNSSNPIAKLRIGYYSGKSSSYRLYIHAVIKAGRIYFIYIYPKTGSFGQESLKSKEEREIIKEFLRNKKVNDLHEVYLDEDRNKICFISNDGEVF